MTVAQRCERSRCQGTAHRKWSRWRSLCCVYFSPQFFKVLKRTQRRRPAQACVLPVAARGLCTAPSGSDTAASQEPRAERAAGPRGPGLPPAHPEPAPGRRGCAELPSPSLARIQPVIRQVLRGGRIPPAQMTSRGLRGSLPRCGICLPGDAAAGGSGLAWPESSI